VQLRQSVCGASSHASIQSRLADSEQHSTPTADSVLDDADSDKANEIAPASATPIAAPASRNTAGSALTPTHRSENEIAVHQQLLRVQTTRTYLDTVSQFIAFTLVHHSLTSSTLASLLSRLPPHRFLLAMSKQFNCQ